MRKTILPLNPLERLFFKAGKELIRLKVENINLSIPNFKNLTYSNTIQSIVEGLLQSEYSFEKYLTEKKTIPSIKKMFILMY